MELGSGKNIHGTFRHSKIYSTDIAIVIAWTLLDILVSVSIARFTCLLPLYHKADKYNNALKNAIKSK